MSDIISFTPKLGCTAQEALADFITKCKTELTVFGPELNFDDDLWDVTDALARKGMGNKRERIRYSTLASAKTKSPESMHPDFKDFAKSYIRYLHGLRPSQSIGHRLGAMRTIEAAMVELGFLPPQPSEINADILNKAIQIACSHFKSQALAHRIGGQFEQIIKFMNSNRLLTSPVY